MKIVWDPRKGEENERLRGLPFGLIVHFDFDSALTGIDDRKDYGEVRQWAIGFIDELLYYIVFTVRSDGLRLISLRRASRVERQLYDQATGSVPD